LRVEVSLRARDDLRGIRVSLAEKSPAAADRLLVRISERFGELRDFTMLGRDRSEFGAALRGLLIENHIAFYIVEADRIVIVRVLDGRMDISREMSQ
jgi:plasmid stabilization system protein ParE